MSSSESECPCSEEGRVECAVCQDLPVWYFDKEKDLGVENG